MTSDKFQIHHPFPDHDNAEFSATSGGAGSQPSASISAFNSPGPGVAAAKLGSSLPLSDDALSGGYRK